MDTANDSETINQRRFSIYTPKLRLFLLAATAIIVGLAFGLYGSISGKKTSTHSKAILEQTSNKALSFINSETAPESGINSDEAKTESLLIGVYNSAENRNQMIAFGVVTKKLENYVEITRGNESLAVELDESEGPSEWYKTFSEGDAIFVKLISPLPTNKYIFKGYLYSKPISKKL